MPLLPLTLRDGLYREFAASRGAQRLFADLLGSDIDWMDRLLTDGALSVTRGCAALTRAHQGPLFERAAAVLLRHGASVGQLLVQLEVGTHVGAESTLYEALGRYCASLRASDIAEVAKLGAEGERHFTRLRLNAEQEERRERVHGLPPQDE